MKKLVLEEPTVQKSKSVYYERKMEKIKRRNSKVLTGNKKRLLLATGRAK
jgi:hypothetical protein